MNADARVWLAENAAEPGTSVITSLPDVSELPVAFDAWRAWFVAAARQILAWVPRDGCAVFYQSDVRHRGVWIDKGYLVLRAAEDAAVPLVWHKVVCRRPPGTIAAGRPSWSHMLCFGATAGLSQPGPDVLADAGAMASPRAMGEAACRVAVRYLVENTPTRVVVDPYCGHGAVLAVANEMGLDAIGVDLSAKRCRAARSFELGRSRRPRDAEQQLARADARRPPR
ncbi:MAG: SAM-dependent methyltransferase [Labilithrix sp.]|nr:SAM-dependent methyltransferase [Labilithrix sp.]MCW5810910.1 SAM-dependent methyltransferase [Labilithrix sp.]